MSTRVGAERAAVRLDARVFGPFHVKHGAVATGMTNGLEVFRSPASIVLDQAENRLHTIKAALVATLA